MFEMQPISCVLIYNLWKKIEPFHFLFTYMYWFDDYIKKKNWIENGNAHKFNMLFSAFELLTFGSEDRVEGIMQERLLKRKFVMDMFQI